MSPEIGSGPYAADLIEAGASRDYYIDIPVQDLANYKSIYLVVSSTRGELKRIGDLAPAIERFVRLLNKSEKDGWGTRYLYVCDQPYVGEPP